MKIVCLLFLGAVAGTAFAQDGAVQSPLDQIRALRLMVEKQGQQIEELRAAVDELKGVRPKEPAPPAAPEPAPVPAAAVEPPKAEPATPAGPQHTVAKGETLTSIAKHYNVSVADLSKANKVTDERKLQIGQVLHIPQPKSPDKPTDKKETP